MINARYPNRKSSGTIAALIAWVMVLTVAVPASRADTKEEVDALSAQLRTTQQRVKELDGLIQNYRQRIDESRSETATLENQIILLDNRTREKELGVERTKAEINSLTVEIKLIAAEIASQEDRITRQRDLISGLMRQINQADEVSTLEVLLAKPSLSSFFSELEELKRLEGDLGSTLDRVKTIKANLEDKKRMQTSKQQSLELQRRSLRQEQLALEAERNYKVSLVSETESKAGEFDRIIYELKQQQQSAGDDISAIEQRIKERLDTTDEALARGDVLLTWPLDASRGVTAIFHDPTYPFRHLFEHPGTDIRAPVGTPVKAAAGGYVAWNKTGRMYGNYTMIVHPGGIATVYAHLSKFMAKPDTYVERGDIIALSGGRPGDAGAGLSSGPHLHFEVREDGIPVNAENFLPSLPDSYFDYFEEYKQKKIKH